MTLSGLAYRLARHLPPNARRLLNAARGIDVPELVDRPRGRRVVVVAPHPDDELLGCGGTLRKHIEGGDTVSVLFVTSGERTAALSLQPAEKRAGIREVEAAAAAQRLGLGPDCLCFLRYPDGSVASRPPKTQSLADAMAVRSPDLLYVPFPYEAHVDHVATARLVADAVTSGRIPTARTVALYEVWTPLCPNTIVDITGQLDHKLAALAEYTSALKSVDYLHTAQGLGAYRSGAGLHGKGYGEAFLVIEPSDLASLLS